MLTNVIFSWETWCPFLPQMHIFCGAKKDSWKMNQTLNSLKKALVQEYHNDFNVSIQSTTHSLVIIGPIPDKSWYAPFQSWKSLIFRKWLQWKISPKCDLGKVPAGVKGGEYTFFYHLGTICTDKCFLVSAYCDVFFYPKLVNVFFCPTWLNNGSM